MSSSAPQEAGAPAGTPRLKRVLTVKDLIFYGIILVTPVAPVTTFGLASDMSHGHVSTTIVIAMVAMMLTAFSYGRMAALYPSAGSAYTYVSRGLGAHVGFLAGWAMFLDYLVIPLINVVMGALVLQQMIPAVPYPVWVILFVVLITILNLRGIHATARANAILLAVMTVVIVAFVAMAIRYLVGEGGLGHLFSLTPFYNPETFRVSDIATATSLAALTYIGFDGVTTLAEEVHNPKRNVLLAVVLVCFLTGVFSTLEVYLMQLAWPDYTTFTNAETAFMDVMNRVGGKPLFHAMGAVMAVSCLGSGLAGQVGAARLLYGMGRENVLPRRLFGHISPRTNIPNFNVLLIGGLTLVGWLMAEWCARAGLVHNAYELVATVLNFGAFLAFMGVNLATISEYYFRRREGAPRVVADLLVPGLGFAFCLGIWLSLPTPAKIAGGAWLLAGVLYDAIKSRGFRIQPAPIDFSDQP